MIIVDDCSTDDTRSIVQERILSDKRIQLIMQSRNQGPAIARNTAMHAARGRYIAFLDSDDLWLPEKLEHQLAFMAEKNAALSYTLYRQFVEDGGLPGPVISLPDTFNYRQLLKNTGIACLTVMVDRKITGPVEMPRYRRAEDYALWLHILKRGFVAHGLMEDLARYRISINSLSSGKLGSIPWVWRVYRDNEKLNFPYAAWCLFNYGWNAYKKHRK